MGRKAAVQKERVVSKVDGLFKFFTCDLTSIALNNESEKTEHTLFDV